MQDESLARLEQALQYSFRSRGLLRQALSHPSARSETGLSNQRLEFLGDAVIGLVVGQFLYTAFPEEPEGELTRLRSRIVSTQALAGWGLNLNLPEVMVLGRGLDRERLPASILADAVEAIVGAAYLDSDLEALTRVILLGLVEQIESAVEGGTRNWKSRLQELTQGRWQETPSYQLIEAHGPDHQKEFFVAVCLGERELGRGEGASKKDAEQAAAQVAYEALSSEEALAPGLDSEE